MSDDETDPELLALLAQSLGHGPKKAGPPRIKVLEDAEFVYDNSTDVAIDMQGTKAAATTIWNLMQEKEFSTKDWSKHELHPKAKDESTVNFIFLMDLLNFSFWSEEGEPFAVEYRGRKWTGYWSLVACIQRALGESIAITSPSFWVDEAQCTDDLLRHVFRSSTSTTIPLLDGRMHLMREAGSVLQRKYDGAFAKCIEEASGSAAALVNLVVDNFSMFDDRHTFEGKFVRFQKRAQILVADLWACFEGESFGTFSDIDQITMFAGETPGCLTISRLTISDYRIPQMLYTLGCISYSPPLETQIRKLKIIESGHSWEIQLRGCSIWCIELLRREIKRRHSDSNLNAILIDFFLYDTIKESEAKGVESIPHHRTRSIWY